MLSTNPDLDAGQVVAEAAYPGPRDQLAVVELDPLQVVAVHQVVQALVSDQRTVVQLCTQHPPLLARYGTGIPQIPQTEPATAISYRTSYRAYGTHYTAIGYTADTTNGTRHRY